MSFCICLFAHCVLLVNLSLSILQSHNQLLWQVVLMAGMAQQDVTITDETWI